MITTYNEKDFYSALKAIDNSKYKSDQYIVKYYMSNNKVKQFIFFREPKKNKIKRI